MTVRAIGWLTSVLASLCAMGAVSSPAQAEELFQRCRGVLVAYFEEQGLLPVLLNRGYQVGDVVNVDGVNLFARGSQCFPNLSVPPPTPAALTTVINTDTAGLSLGLKLRQIFDSSIGADLARRIQISFSDVSIRGVSLLDLRAALDRRSCPDIAPLIDGTMTPSPNPDSQFYFVISEVLTGKYTARLEFGVRANLDAKGAQLAKLAGDANVAVQVGTDGTVTLTNAAPLPIALRPVTVPHIVTLRSFSNTVRGDETKSTALRWQALTCRTTETCVKQIGPLAERMKSANIVVQPGELDQ